MICLNHKKKHSIEIFPLLCQNQLTIFVQSSIDTLPSFFFLFITFRIKKITFFFILRFSRLRKQLDLSDCFLILVETDTLLFSILSLVNVKKKKENLRIRKEIHWTKNTQSRRNIIFQVNTSNERVKKRAYRDCDYF